MGASGTQSEALRTAVEVARNRCAQGMALSDALEPAHGVLPHYVLPVIRAGETGGRLVEAFRLLHDHARRLGPSLTLVRNTWLYPLVCVVFGWLIRTGIYVTFGQVLEQQGSFGDIFAEVTLFETRFKGLIATGAFCGQLDRSLTAIVEEAASQLDAALHAFNQVFHLDG